MKVSVHRERHDSTLAALRITCAGRRGVWSVAISSPFFDLVLAGLSRICGWIHAEKSRLFSDWYLSISNSDSQSPGVCDFFFFLSLSVLVVSDKNFEAKPSIAIVQILNMKKHLFVQFAKIYMEIVFLLRLLLLLLLLLRKPQHHKVNCDRIFC